jgi:hypothetical protein
MAPTQPARPPRAPYAEQMTIRTIALLTLSSCGFASNPAPVTDEAETEEQAVVANTCDPRNYPCDPVDPLSNAICQIICEGDGSGYGYCMSYNAVEIKFCELNPGRCIASLKCCSPTGDPLWQTRCVPGWLP